MPTRDPDLQVNDVLEAAPKIQLYVAGIVQSTFPMN
jgi:uncharacterized protein with HEPN domain